MPIDIHGFNYAPNRFEGLYKMGDDIQQERLRKEALLKQQQGNLNANAKYLTDYLDSKDHLTGTPFDPVLVQKYQGVLNKALGYAQEGADLPNILMAIGKDVGDLNEYSTKAKTLNEQLKNQLGQLKEFKGYNIQALDQEAKKAAFYNPDGTLKDISQVDPDQNYIADVIKNSPEKVTNDAGLDDFITKAGKLENDQDITTYKPSGGMSKKRVRVSAAPFMQLDKDTKGVVTSNDLVPQYEHALDGGQPILHNGQPVRLLDNGLFKSMMSQRPDMADWVRGQVKQHLNEYQNTTGQKVDENSPQASLIARSILYDELKNRARGSVMDNEIQNKPSPYEIKNYLGIPYYRPSSSGAGGDLTINDVFGRIRDKVDNGDIINHSTGHRFGRFNTLSNDEQGVVMNDIAKTGDKTPGNDLFLKNVGDGKDKKIEVYKITEDDAGHRAAIDTPENLITVLSPTGTNLPNQPTSKLKTKVIDEGAKKPPSKHKDPLGIL